MQRGEADLCTFYTAEQWVKLADDAKFTERYWPFRWYEASYGWIGWNEKRPFCCSDSYEMRAPDRLRTVDENRPGQWQTTGSRSLGGVYRAHSITNAPPQA